MITGTLLIVVYWAIFTIRKGFTPKLAAATKANVYDMNRNDPDAKKSAERKHGLLVAAKWALRVAGWIEMVLLVLLTAWVIFLIGAYLTLTVFRSPV